MIRSNINENGWSGNRHNDNILIIIFLAPLIRLDADAVFPDHDVFLIQARNDVNLIIVTRCIDG